MLRVFLFILIVLGVGLLFTQSFWLPPLVNWIIKNDNLSGTTTCTLEAKICPDGSAVGRTGPRCEFAACPGTTNSKQTIVNGSVTLSPICPVERIPPDPKCAPKPLETDIQVFAVNGDTPIKTVRSRSDGSFNVTLPYGDYTLQPVGGNPFPRCSSTTLTLQTSLLNNVSLSCDTGIR